MVRDFLGRDEEFAAFTKWLNEEFDRQHPIGACEMNAADFRRIALSLEGAEEGSHMGAVDFRVGGRIFATLASVKPGLRQPDAHARTAGRSSLPTRPDLFLPIHGGWGRNGATHIRLAAADEDQLRGALHTAWKLRVEKNRNPSKKSDMKPEKKGVSKSK